MTTAAAHGPEAAPVGRSLHIGLNSVDPASYEGWSGPLDACEADARDLTALARQEGFAASVTLLTKEATRARVLAELARAVAAAKPGDLFVLSFSGHGGQVRDLNRDEIDGLDETWCLFDGQLVDDELYLELARFVPGVRVLVLSDSCHSGTVTRAAARGAMETAYATAIKDKRRPRMMPPDVERTVRMAQRARYDKIQQQVATASEREGFVDPDVALGRVPVGMLPATGRLKPLRAEVLLLSGCQDNEVSLDGDRNGAFTEALLATWDGGRFKGDLRAFHKAIKDAMLPTQMPNFYPLGKGKLLAAQRPFTV